MKLFERTHQGLALTKAGKSLYQDTKYIIQYCRDSVTRAKNAMQEDAVVIRIRTSPMTPAQLRMQLWPKIQVRCPDLKFEIIPFENTPENAREILANLGRNTDVIGGIFDETMPGVRSCAGAGTLTRAILLYGVRTAQAYRKRQTAGTGPVRGKPLSDVPGLEPLCEPAAGRYLAEPWTNTYHRF